MHPIPQRLLPLAASLATLLPAQEAPTAEDAAKRFAATGDLLEMEWRRDAAGRLETTPKGENAWRPLVADSLLESMQATGAVGFLMAWLHGPNDLLGMTDAERHLRRLGVATSTAELRQYLPTPLAKDAALQKAELLDRLVAIDLLRRRGDKNAVADLEAFAGRPDLPAVHRPHVLAAIAALRGSTTTAAPGLDPATVELPVAADVFVVFDNRRIPDSARLSDIGRTTGLMASMRVLRLLKAPRLDDFRVGQTESDTIGELPFEAARRFGNHRLDQGLLALMFAPDGPGAEFCAECSGTFDVAALSAGLTGVLADSGLELATKDGTLAIHSKDLDVRIGATRGTFATSRMRGKPRPERARELLALGDAAIHVVFPAQSKALMATATAGLPSAQNGSVDVTFLPTFRIRATVTARDEDGAEEWVTKSKALLEGMAQQLDAGGAAATKPELTNVIAALKGVHFQTEGNRVTAELDGRNLGLSTLTALFEAQFR